MTTQSLLEYPPVSDAITDQVRVEVIARYSKENSQPMREVWVFEYTVRITNLGSENVQLLSRRWTITDALDRPKEVQGPGVIGKQPILAAGESFKYSSWCPLRTTTGFMQGTYRMAGADGKEFDVRIAPFGLRAPQRNQ